MGSPYKPLAVVFLVILVAKASVDVSFGSRVYSDDVLCIESEKQALLSFKRDLIDPSDRLSSWTAEDRECCRWAGVVCDNVTGHVKELGLSSSDLGYEDQLKGKINPSLLELKYLTYLDLSYNDFLGTQIPSFFGSLVSLRYLNLSGVGLVGKIPHQLGNLSSLIHLDLRGPELLSFGYQLYADSLDWLSTLSSLQYLDMSSRYLGEASDWLLSINKLPSLLELRLSYCQLPHIHPVSHVNLTSLKILDISSNSFVSSSLGWLFSLHNLVSIDLSGNNLGHNDPIPCGLRNMTQLKNLDLSDNDFNSTIPKCLYRFANLEHLLLSSNILQGVMSSAIGNLTSLVGLDLSSNALEGKIPPTMGKLCNLESLSLGGNKLGGKVSNALKSLSGCNPNRLKLLNLVGNSFTGEITDQIGELENLVELNLRSNLLSGPIPMSLRKLSSLEMLYIDDNKLNGTLPEWFGSLSNLKEVDISYNLFRGVVSEVHLANLTNLYYLDASKNSLILRVSPDWVPPFYLRALLLRSLNLGPRFPMWLKSQRNFTVMDLSDTRISGAIPNWFWNLSNRISFLNLSHNQLHGKVPSLNLHRPYSVIYLDSNKFEGPLPRISSNVQELDLSDNSFSGDISHFLCHPIGVGNILDLVHLGRNLLSGNIPDCWMHWPSLQVIKLDDNNLTGEIPRSIGSLQHLESLHLRNNSLSGEIPPSLRNCTTLKVIDLGLNNFVGKIPAWIGLDLSNLMVLSLRANKFGGMIPNEICHLARLQILDAADNYLSGSIPICFKNFISMATKPDSGHVISYSMFANFLEDAVVVTRGREDRYDKILRLVASLDLSNNNLSGELPEELTTLHGLLSLNLSGNHLRGKIPDSISSLRWVQSVDLSRNQLTSKIPPSISDLSFLSQFNVSHNNLSGEIPLGTQLQSLDPSCFMGNQLCGPPLPKRCRADQNTMPTDNEDEKGQKESGDGDDEEYWFRLGIAVGFAVGFLGIISPLVLCRFYRCAYYWFFQEYLWYKILDCYIKFKRMGRQ